MREIISLHLGQTGRRLGQQFWSFTSKEHGINPTSGDFREDDAFNHKMLVFHYQNDENKYSPRAIFADIDVVDEKSDFRNQFSTDYLDGLYVENGKGSTGSVWAKGYYTEGVEMADKVMELVRLQAERCDSMQGFQLMHSVGGGTGAGMGSLLLDKLREEFPEKILVTYTILPSAAVSNVPQEPYNAQLSLAQLVQESDVTYCIDNHSLFDICRKYSKGTPNYDDMNHVANLGLNGITTSLRFPGLVNNTLANLALETIPFPSLHFLTSHITPLDKVKFADATLEQLIPRVFESTTALVQDRSSNSKYLSMTLSLRSDKQLHKEDILVKDMKQKKSKKFFSWNARPITMGHYTSSPLGYKSFVTMIGNSTGIQHSFKAVLDQVSSIFKKREHLHHYTDEGMDITEIEQSVETINNLIQQYRKL